MVVQIQRPYLWRYASIGWSTYTAPLIPLTPTPWLRYGIPSMPMWPCLNPFSCKPTHIPIRFTFCQIP